MDGKCSQPSCFPEDTGCNVEGCTNLTDCKYYGKTESSKKENKKTADGEGYRISWTGNAFGLIDLNFLTASFKPILIGITGVANAGKTTFLASLYCLLRHGGKIGDYSFAGSLTLNGWEDIAWYLSWKSNGEIQFPEHTTSNSGRVPGLLHLALKNKDGEKVDLIFTDAPGEWFDYWSNNVNSENAQGAKWIYEYCDGFLLFADCDMLSGNNRGNAKRQLIQVADRLLEDLDDRSLGLVWSKSDIDLTNDTKEQIVKHIKSTPFKHFNQFETSVQEGNNGIFHNNILRSINWIIEKSNGNYNTLPNISVLKPEDMFLSKRLING
ncbi:MAG: hypothetical protein H6566_25785 [Lewinellaceae bacterium]|nr:hypothetical protein [Lewinellaceae bacterium]